MFLFALLLPVILGFLGLSMAASALLDARAKLDEASLSAAVAASSDSCMSSAYSFDLLACSHPTPFPYPASWTTPPSTTAQMPQPPVTTGAPFYPATTLCSDSPSTACAITEHTAAQASAEDSVTQVLQADYPNLTVTKCAATVAPATAPCSPMTGSNIEFQAEVSYWYYYDYDDAPGAPLTACSNACYDPAVATPSDDAFALNSGSTPGDVNSDNDGDCCTVSPAVPGHLVCPATYNFATGKAQFARQIVVTVWVQATNPFAGVIGIPNTVMTSATTTYGCSTQ